MFRAFVVSRDGCTFGSVAYFFYAVPIALRKKKHGYETKKEKDFFIPTTWFIVTDPATGLHVSDDEENIS